MAAVRAEQMSQEKARRELLATMPSGVMSMLLDAWAAALGQPALLTLTVEADPGKQARTFREWVTAHAAAFGA